MAVSAHRRVQEAEHRRRGGPGNNFFATSAINPVWSRAKEKRIPLGGQWGVSVLGSSKEGYVGEPCGQRS
jgi:hypothetical protein